jgi:hypothetical protein
MAGVWLGFWVIGWAGLNAQNFRGLVAPRMADREAPVRLRREYQLTGDESVFENMPKLYVPYPEINVVYAVLHDKWSQGRLPPSLQSSQGGFILNPGFGEEGDGGVGLRGEAAVHLREGAITFTTAFCLAVFSYRDCEVAQACHHVGGAALDHVMAVFVVGVVPAAVQPVLNPPVRPLRRAQRFFAELFASTAANHIDGLLLDPPVGKLPAALDAHHLCDVRKGQLAGLHRARHQLARLDAPAILLTLPVRRGEKTTRAVVVRRLRGVRVGCFSP